MQKEKKYIAGKKVLSVLLLFVSVLVFQYGANAEESLLSTTGMKLYAGDSFAVSDYYNKGQLKKVDAANIQYSVSKASVNKDCVKLSGDGKVTAVKEGTAIITVSYLLTGETKRREENLTVTVLAPEQITVSYGEIFCPQAFDLYNPYDGNYTFSYSNSSLAMDDSKKGLCVQGFKAASVYLEKNKEQILVAEVTINAPALETNKVARATETDPFYPVINNFIPMEGDSSVKLEQEKIVWTVEDPDVAVVTEKGIQAVAEGKTKGTVKLTAKNGDSKKLTLKELSVTDPKAADDAFAVAAGVTKKLPVTGTVSYSTYSYAGEEASFDYSSLVEKGKLIGESVGKETIKVLIDGRIVEIVVSVTNPTYDNYKFTMYKGLKKNFELSGLDETCSTVTYSTSDATVATVSKDGKVTAKKVGVTKITAKADGRKITVWAEISTKKGYQAAMEGIAISNTKTRYSQAKRMEEGYYDCSSLVSRIYREYGVYFGSKSGWAPVAADIGKWCSDNDLVVAKKGIADTKLVPGDLIFYSFAKNGRFKNISHVEIYTGDGIDVSASDSKNKVIQYSYNPNNVVLIARPTK